MTPSIVADCNDNEHFSGISDDKYSYTVPALRNTHPPNSVRTHAREETHSTLYMGAGGIFSDAYEGDTSETPINDTLIEFYIIYVPDLTTLPQPNGRTKTDYTGKLAASKASLSLCAHTYNSSMHFGVTNTTMQGQETHLPWSHGSATDDNNLYGYLASVQGTPDTFFMNPMSMNGLSVWLITSIFNGTAAMPPPPPPPTKGPDADSPLVIPSNGQAIFSTVASKQVALALYGNETGIRVKDGVNAMSILLDNVAMSMSNG